jgi:quercetin dioxygenase-like cupin family protein
MIIQTVLEQLETATNPVAKALHKGDQSKVLIIGFKKGMVLKEHKTHVPANLTVLTGRVIYHEGETQKVLAQYDETVIPIEMLHSVEALEDSLCLLCQG